MLTRALVRTGARVVAIERDAALAGQLARRFPGVEVVAADAVAMRLPREPFVVAANLPFGSGTAILRRILEPDVPLEQAALIVGWGLATKRASVWPSSLLGVYWGAWHRLEIVRRLPPSAFAPPPSVVAAVLRVTRRREPLVRPDEAAAYRRFLERGFAAGPRPLVPWKTLRRAAHEHGFDPRARAVDLDAEQWAVLFDAVRSPRRIARGPR
jgi:23S rRNA (adenine-N6)-dimethyltransferase